jgi:hypothetical protein
MRCLLTVVGLLLAGTASAQTTIQPTQAQFTASPDHSAVVTGTTTPIVTNYTIEVRAGVNVVLAPVSIGKPTPDGANLITVPLPASVLALPKNTVYTAVVAAVGPSGSAASGVSNFFVFAPAPQAPGVPVVKP